MITVTLDHAADFDGWRMSARKLLLDRHAPEEVIWQVPGNTADLFGASDLPNAELTGTDTVTDSGTGGGGPQPRGLRVSRDFLDLARRVVCHRDPVRFALLYRLLWRQAHGEPRLLHNVCDVDVHQAGALGKAVGRDMHKMRAFLRFRRSTMYEADHYHAWFEPDHHILRYNCEFFQRRFAAMHWSIVTPEASAHWNGNALHFGPTVNRDALPDSEPMETLWRTYFASIFNPARLRLNAMRSEMPMKYWKNLPEASLIAPLTHQAGVRTDAMVAAAPTLAPRFATRALHVSSHEAHLGQAASAGRKVGTPSRVELSGKPEGGPGFEVRAADLSAPSLVNLAQEVSRCERCAHACEATQAVPGVGPSDSAVMLVGEQPGDQEDLRGRPFVGPAGQLLRQVLGECGCDIDSIYTTNAVKHFKFSVRGKLRLHQRPSEQDIAACQPWLQREIELVSPRIIVALGATAARALLGRHVKIQAERGCWLSFSATCRLMITSHPSFVLRQRTTEQRDRARETLQRDLASVF